MRGRAWVWVAGGVVAVLAVVLVVVLVVRDDDTDSTAPSTSTTTTSTTTTTTTPPTSAAPPTTTVAPPTTTRPLPPVTDDPQSYAEFLFVAWQNGNQGAAADVADAEAVAQMFSEPYDPSVAWTEGGCDPAAGSLYCNWSGSGGATITMTVRTLTGGLPIQVVMVERQGG